jgi:hypothetical protein
MPNSSQQPRYTLTYPLGTDPEYAIRFDSLTDCIDHVKGARYSVREGIVVVRIFDALTQKHGRLFPSGRVRWNG